MLYQNLITMLAASVLVVPMAQAHPGEVDQILTPRQLERRQAAINARHAVVRNCDKEIKDFEVRRRARRSAYTTQKHGNGPPRHGNSSTKCSSAASGTETSTANTPTYTTLQNTTCVLSPEGEEGPYYIHEELFRTNIREGQEGVPLLLDIGVMDVSTCTPMENALVDIWHCNAIGIYSGFIASESSNTGSSSASGTTSSASMSAPATPSGTMSASGSGPGGGTVATDQETYLRGAYPTNKHGLVEFSTIFPGFYAGRTIHIHTVVLTNYSLNANGTIGLEAGKIRHVGQLFFEESWSELVLATSPYNQETITRTLNDVDRVFTAENTAGYNATAQLTMLGNDISEGFLGYVTLGVDPTASYDLVDPSYYTGA